MKENESKTTLNTPISKKEIKNLKAGDIVEITGQIITARDEAYHKLLEKKRKGEESPIDLTGTPVYHCGPLVKKTKSGWEIIAAGPTTSARMDEMEKEFVEKTGANVLIGKGGVGEEVAKELGSLGCIYLTFTGGAAALAADSITDVEDVFWVELGIPEAMWMLNVERFGPLLVTTDLEGENLYEDIDG